MCRHGVEPIPRPRKSREPKDANRKESHHKTRKPGRKTLALSI